MDFGSLIDAVAFLGVTLCAISGFLGIAHFLGSLIKGFFYLGKKTED